MNSRRNLKFGHKVSWKRIKLMGTNHLNTGLSAVTSVEDASANLNVEKMEGSVQDAWMNLELSKAYAEKLRARIA